MNIQSLKTGLRPYYTQIANFGYLSLLQVFNMALPLLTYPYLVRVLGSETYGMVIYSQAVISYLVVLINFGFNSTATKKISIHRNDRSKLSEIVSSVYIIKGSLFLISVVILSVCLFWLDTPAEFRLLFYLTLWMCLYEFLFPLWYFQGMEKMKYITFITLTSRVLFLVLVFLLVKSNSDYLLVPLINGLGSLLSCLFAFIILRRDAIKLELQSNQVLASYIRDSYIMAISYGANIVKTNFSIIVVKHLFSFSEVIYVDVAMKIINLATTFLDMISQAVFPRMSISKDKKFFQQIFKIAVAASVVLMLTIQVASLHLVRVIGGSEMPQAAILTVIFALNLPVYIAGALFGRNCLLIYGYDKEILLSMTYSALLYVLLMGAYSSISNTFDLTAFAVIYLISFLFETLYRYRACGRYDLLSRL